MEDNRNREEIHKTIGLYEKRGTTFQYMTKDVNGNPIDYVIIYLYNFSDKGNYQLIVDDYSDTSLVDGVDRFFFNDKEELVDFLLEKNINPYNYKTSH